MFDQVIYRWQRGIEFNDFFDRRVVNWPRKYLCFNNHGMPKANNSDQVINLNERWQSAIELRTLLARKSPIPRVNSNLNYEESLPRFIWDSIIKKKKTKSLFRVNETMKKEKTLFIVYCHIFE